MIEIPGYQILRLLGHGGMATVYLAQQKSLGREVALKVLIPTLASDRVATERFLREARVSAKLHHPNIVAIFDVGVHEGVPYMAIAYEPGGTVAGYSQARNDPKVALRIIRDIANALDFAHRQGVVHRDVKPENILLRNDGTCVLSDFGIAHAIEAQTGLTREGTSVGTPHYMSPEQLRGEHVDARADIYSLGVVLFQLLTGELPYQGTDGWAIGMQHIAAPIPHLPPHLEHLQTFLDALLAKNPDNRLQTGSEVVHWIDARLSGQGPAMTVAMPTPVPIYSRTPPGARGGASIAILPFADLSQTKDQEYLADGITEELSNLLTKVPGLFVASRSSAARFKGGSAKLAEVGRELKVATVLEGSVRKFGERVRISVQLIDVQDGFQRWSETYDRTLTDVFATQDEIAALVLAALKEQLLPNAEAEAAKQAAAKAEAQAAAEAREREAARAQRLEEEQRQSEEEKRQREIGERIMQKKREREEAERLAAERKAKEDAERAEAERLAAEHEAHEQAERAEAERRAAERKAREEAERAEAERLAAEREAREQAERAAAERAAAEQRRREEIERIAAEQRAQEEKERQEREAAERAEAERQRREEEERAAAEQRKREAEAEEARRRAEEARAAAQAEAAELQRRADQARAEAERAAAAASAASAAAASLAQAPPAAEPEPLVDAVAGEEPLRDPARDFASAYLAKPGGKSPDSTPPAQPAPPSKISPAKIGIAAGALLVLLVGGWLFWQNRQQQNQVACQGALLQGQAGLDDGDFDRAGASLLTAHGVCSDEAEASLKSLEDRINSARELAQTCGTALTQARGQLHGGKPDAAAATLAPQHAACAEYPGYAELEALPANAKSRAGELVMQIEPLIRANDWSGAQSLADQVAMLDVEADGFAALRERLAKHAGNAAPLAAAPEAPPPVAPAAPAPAPPKPATPAEAATAKAAAAKAESDRLAKLAQDKAKREAQRAAAPAAPAPVAVAAPEPAAAPAPAAPAAPRNTAVVAASTPQPPYPPQARRAGISGEVTVAFVVNTDGSVGSVRIVNAKPRGVFDRPVLTAVERWRFQPVDEPQPATRTISFRP